MSFFGLFGGDSDQEANKPKSEPKPAANDGGGGFFSPITNIFGWGSSPAAAPAATPTPTTGPTTTPTTGQTPTTAPTQDPTQPPTTAVGPQAPAPEKPVDPKMVRETANNLFKAMDGWGTDEDTLLNALRGKSPAEINAIKAEYADHFGRSLDDDIGGELGGKDLEEAKAASTKREFLRDVEISLREAREALYWLRIYRELELGDPATVRKLVAEADALVRILTSIVVSTKRRMAVSASVSAS